MNRILAAALLLIAMTGAASAQARQVLRMATTTSTEQSGLLAHLLPRFEAVSGIKVHIIAVGSGKALALARNGDVDLVLVHARQAEDRLVADGAGVDRRDVMYNDFIVVGPPDDPARIKTGKDVVVAFRKIAASGARFISRGDESGTHIKEKEYWKLAGTRPAGVAYVQAGQGMGEVLNMAGELSAYTLADRASFGAWRARTGLAVMVQGDARMVNPYGIIAVNPARHSGVNYRAARRLIDWIVSPEGQGRIAAFKPGGQQLFFPAPIPDTLKKKVTE